MKHMLLDPMDGRPSSNRGQDQPLPQPELCGLFIQRLKNMSSSSASPNVYSMNVKRSGTCSGETGNYQLVRYLFIYFFQNRIVGRWVLKGNYKLVLFFLL